ncbi:unnamed protein product [Mycena citricolor]|uniref:ABC transporter domain-containing protein n=1 Tax=Mycena citricolor TaxID=2018698 RepID=A0AAD2H7T3_9AGAR|nr:unnamed protein product [Mycena citricolor]
MNHKDVQMAYREGRPLVLKSVSFEVKVAEKIGIVGLTGAGKSSPLQRLFRVVELQSGEVDIEGRSIPGVSLDALRGRLALVPQESVLFLGMLWENLDPQNSRTGAELFPVLQRPWLLPRPGEPSDPTHCAGVSDPGIPVKGTKAYEVCVAAILRLMTRAASFLTSAISSSGA